MASEILSIDIREDLLCAARVEQHGSGVLVHSYGHGGISTYQGQVIAEALANVLDQLKEVPTAAVLGLPLALAGLRNLHLPFTERKKIAQVLPLELEEQLLASADQYIFDFTITNQDKEGSSVLVATVEKEMLAQLVEILARRGCRLKNIFLTMEALCHACMQRKNIAEPALFLCGDNHALSMALWDQDQVVFMRRILWPEPLAASAVSAEGAGGFPAASDKGQQVMAGVCNQIQVSLYYATRGWQQIPRPKQAVLCGGTPGLGVLEQQMADDLGLALSVWQPGSDIAGLALEPSVRQQWNPAMGGPCVELALIAQQRKNKQRLLNFLRGEFAPGSEQYLSKRSMQAIAAGVALLAAGLFAFLWFGYQRLDSRAEDLLARMNAIYQQAFPGGAKKVDRPYLYMQSKMRELDTDEVALPLFSGNKRVLEILADISSRIPEDLTLHVSRLVIDAQSVQLKGTTDAFNNVDVIKNRLAASGKYSDVKIVSATADKKKGGVRFEIHLQLGEAS